MIECFQGRGVMEITLNNPDELAVRSLWRASIRLAKLWKIWQLKPTEPIVLPVRSSVVYWAFPPDKNWTLFSRSVVCGWNTLEDFRREAGAKQRSQRICWATGKAK